MTLPLPRGALLLLLLLPACAHTPRPGLEGLAPLLGQALPSERREDVRAQLAGGSDAERALAAALLYRDEPQLALLTPWFRVQDGARRHQVSQEDFIARIKAVEAAHPEVRDQRVHLLLGYLALREENLWFTAGGRELSAARFLRSAFLAVAFQGTALDAVAVAQQLDADLSAPR